MSIIECSSSDEAEILEAHVRFLAELLKGAEAAKRSWDCIQLTLLSYSGAIRGGTLRANLPFWYPQTKQDTVDTHPEHFDDLVDFDLQLEVPALEEPFDPDEELDALAQDAQAVRDCERRLAIVRKALKHRSLASLRSAYLETARYGIQWTSENEVYYECDFAPLDGKRLPLPPRPQGALGVIARLRCAQHSYLGGSDPRLVWSGAKLVGATLSGAAVSDRTIALLEDVEDVGELCAGLKSLRLEHTAVSKKGLALAKRLLPHTKVERAQAP